MRCCWWKSELREQLSGQVRVKRRSTRVPFVTSVFKHLFSFRWWHCWSTQLQLSPADKPHIFFLSQVDKIKGWQYTCPPWSWGGWSYYVFLKLFISTPPICFCHLTSWPKIFYICQFKIFFPSFGFFFLFPAYSIHICLPLMRSVKLSVRGSSSPSPFCGHEVAVPPCGTLTPQQS